MKCRGVHRSGRFHLLVNWNCEGCAGLMVPFPAFLVFFFHGAVSCRSNVELIR